MNLRGPIPAWAGQPVAGQDGQGRGRAYPRVGGAARCTPPTSRQRRGLSPRGRGSPSLPRFGLAHERPIPAWAGQPSQTPQGISSRGAYPRVGGAAVRSWLSSFSRHGLSPRGRGSRCAGTAGDSSRGAYPRVGGAARSLVALVIFRKGLSPRGRGSLDDLMLRMVLPGPIPAWAGQPGAVVVRVVAPEAYPRVGGAAPAGFQSVGVSGGLSPRGRGSQVEAFPPGSGRGPIPAWAGQPRTAGTRARERQAYPRVGGAATMLPFGWFGGKGLSPRGRGSRLAQGLAEDPAGPIPAWAGQPTAPVVASGDTMAYPRVGGAASNSTRETPAATGLSPRGRGSLDQVGISSVRIRPIPAWAGQPYTLWPILCLPAAYPRVGGAASSGATPKLSRTGLSPRGRGSLVSARTSRAVSRPIPAWAGQPQWLMHCSGSRGAYPRVGGAAVRYFPQFRHTRGLSPRGRGSPSPGR